MHCEEFRSRYLDGIPLESDIQAHASGCPACREEFPFIDGLRNCRPAAPSGLRDRVLAAFPIRQAHAWKFAAGLLVGLAGGLLAGRTAFRPAPVVVEVPVVRTMERIVEKPAPFSDQEITVLAVALKATYGTKVEVDFDGVRCREIRADAGVRKFLPHCPIVQEMDRLSKERPDMVAFR